MRWLVCLFSCLSMTLVASDALDEINLSHGLGHFKTSRDGWITGRKLKLVDEDRERRLVQIQERLAQLHCLDNPIVKLSIPAYHLKKKDEHWSLRWDCCQNPEGIVVYEPFAGGCTNTVFMASYKGYPCILRLSRECPGELGICRERELTCLQAASKVGVCPKVRYSAPNHQVLVQDFVSGDLLFQKGEADTTYLEEIVDIMRCYHKVPHHPDMKAPSIFEQVREMLAQAEAIGNLLNVDELQWARQALKELQTTLEGKGKYGLCHNDMWLQNVIRDPNGRIWVIDWEYGGWNSVYRDLASLCVPNQLKDVDCLRVVQRYFKKNHKKHAHRLLGYRSAVTLWEGLWCYIQSKNAGVNQDSYQTMGKERYQAFTQLMESYRQAGAT